MSHIIYPLPVFEVCVDKGAITYRHFNGKMVWIPAFSWLIEVGREKILVDCPGSAREMEQYSTAGFAAKDIRPLEDSLKDKGISVEEITTIIVSHLHHDHIAGARKFPNARVIIQEKELAFAKNPHPLFKKSFRVDLFKGIKFEVVQGDTRVFPGVEVLLTPGHTPGCQSVAVDTAQGKAIIAGFCSIKENFFPPDPINKTFAVIPPGILVNSLEAFDSTLRVKESADILIPLHEEEMVSRKTIP